MKFVEYYKKYIRFIMMMMSTFEKFPYTFVEYDETAITESILLNILNDLIDRKYTGVGMSIDTINKTIILSLYKDTLYEEPLKDYVDGGIKLIKHFIQIASEKLVHIKRKGFSGGSISSSGNFIKIGEYMTLAYKDEKVVAEWLMKNNQ